MDGLDPTRTALLVMDFQNYQVHPKGFHAAQGVSGWPAAASGAIATTARVVAAARSLAVPVIHIGAAWRKGHPEMNLNIPGFARGPDRSVEGTWGADFYVALRPADGEIVILKRSVSALAGTELDRLLRVKEINTLVLTGVATNGVVEGTAREAVDRGYRVIVLEDCCASLSQEMHDFSIGILRELCIVSTADEFVQRQEAPSPGPEGAAALEQNRALMRRFIEEFQNGHDLGVLDEILAPDFVNRTRPAASDREGLKEVGRLWFAAFPDARMTVDDVIAEGEMVVVRKSFHGTHRGDFLGIPPTGKDVSGFVIDISRIRNGQIVEHWSAGTAEAELLEQLRAAAP